MALAKQLTFFLVAGEESGDLHGSRLIRNIKQQSPGSRFIGHGGDKLAAEGTEILEHVNDLSIMGFTEVIKHLPYMLKVMTKTVAKIEEVNPDRIILIDYPGFNLRLMKKCSELGIPITYFILPQVWAWKEKRANILREHVDQALSIFPFEQEWFKKRGVSVQFVGHPFAELNSSVLDTTNIYEKHGLNPEAPILTLLPGSRQQEINLHWPTFLLTVECLKKTVPSLQILVGKAPAVELNPVPKYFRVEADNVYLAIRHGTAALVASGTATLETAVLNTPMVVCYRFSESSWWIVRRMTKVPYAAMVNLIANRQVVPEFLQSDMQPETLTKALLPLLSKTDHREKMLSGFEEVRRRLGSPGVYKRAAKAILKRTLQ